MINSSDLGKLLVVAGIGIVVLGLLLWVGGRFSFFGHLPGDISIQRPNGSIFIPLGSCLLLSIVLTVLVNLLLVFFRRH